MDLGFWGEQGLAEAVHVAQVQPDGGVGETKLVEVEGGVPWTDVTFARKRRDADGVLQLRLRKVVTYSPIHVTLQREEGETGRRKRARK